MRASTLLAGLVLVAAPARAADELGSLPTPGTGVTRLYLVRHAQANSNLEPRPNLPDEQLNRLTDLGRRQAQAAARALSGLGIGSVLASPVARARNTAKVLTDGLQLGEPVVDRRLRSLETGRAPDGHAYQWSEREALLKRGTDPRPDGGESLEDVARRVDELARELAGRWPTRPAILVSHGEVIAAWVGRLRGVAPWKRYPPGLANGALAVVDVSPDGRAEVRLESFVPE